MVYCAKSHISRHYLLTIHGPKLYNRSKTSDFTRLIKISICYESALNWRMMFYPQTTQASSNSSQQPSRSRCPRHTHSHHHHHGVDPKSASSSHTDAATSGNQTPAAHHHHHHHQRSSTTGHLHPHHHHHPHISRSHGGHSGQGDSCGSSGSSNPSGGTSAANAGRAGHSQFSCSLRRTAAEAGETSEITFLLWLFLCKLDCTFTFYPKANQHFHYFISLPFDSGCHLTIWRNFNMNFFFHQVVRFQQ